MDIREAIKSGRLYLDGSMGTLLQGRGLRPGERPETWVITHPEKIEKIHTEYLEAGTDIVSTDTFGANTLRFGEGELEDIIREAIACARRAVEKHGHGYVAFDVGPLGKLLKPSGSLDFEDAVNIFKTSVKYADKYGADLVFIETMNDSLETKAALLAVKESTDLPVFVSNAYNEKGRLMNGATPEAMATMLTGLGADAIGANCSVGLKQLVDVIRQMSKYTNLPILVKPNAGMPREVDGKTVFEVSPCEFADTMAEMAGIGATIMGGCCGTTPEYIRKTVEKTKGIIPEREECIITAVCSFSKCVAFGGAPIIIGERINPTGKKKLKAAILEGDTDYLLREAIAEDEAGCHILDVNVGVPGVDEEAVMAKAITEIQTVTDLPLQPDTSNPRALEKALRLYNGKALINSVSGRDDSMKNVFPLMKKYGGVAVALPLDERGIPEAWEGRVQIAERIIKTAAEYGISERDLVFDPLCMSVAADNRAADTTLKTLKAFSERGLFTVMGISNVSFGLPCRDRVNSSFLLMSLERGLSSVIMNPLSKEMMGAYRSFMLLRGQDENASEYLLFAEGDDEKKQPAEEEVVDLSYAIRHGMKDRARSLCEKLLGEISPMDCINCHIIPALDEVGRDYECGKTYLPGLLTGAEAAGAAFEAVKAKISESGDSGEKRSKIVLATVEGDVHDIGKNIVKVMLDNYGFEVIDLGRDVPPEKILDAVIRESAPLCGLSALMTTTVPAMEKTVKLIHEKAPFCKVVVGGAVLTEEYAEKIGADKYARDAMETVRYAEKQEKS